MGEDGLKITKDTKVHEVLIPRLFIQPSVSFLSPSAWAFT
jgi:hypothetical protein